ncbi:cytochrome c1, heme protein, mitochondrial [Drosophila teissieri]|uniref:cytochrome c1, heme protein, mitochondrial n=1 Tax=Drosophila teissieri TaxID=7243 RepID=UPI001CBA1E47|nr:cytochrome c1, heme protein, mitochondrial [Drosophila teissieri]
MANKFRNLNSKLCQLARSSFQRTSVRPRMSFPGRESGFTGNRKVLGALGALTGTAGLLIYALESSVDASSDCVHPAHQHWNHKGLLSALDKESVRRGYTVYKEVCSSCHSLQYMAYRNLVGVCMTEAEAKAEAEAITVRDGPNDEGEYYERPGKLSDHFPSPYANEEAARSANNGSYPPDLSYIVSARKGGEDYVFSLLTGYCEPPAGFALRDGLYFNPYFSGGAIAMGKVVDNEVVTYEDSDVPASAAQIAKDVCVFLKWTSEPESDERRLLLIKVTLISAFLIGISYYIKRFKWSTLKSRKIFFIPELEAQAKREAEKAAKAAYKAKQQECNKCENQNDKKD